MKLDVYSFNPPGVLWLSERGENWIINPSMEKSIRLSTSLVRSILGIKNGWAVIFLAVAPIHAFPIKIK